MNIEIDMPQTVFKVNLMVTETELENLRDIMRDASNSDYQQEREIADAWLIAISGAFDA